MIMTFLIVERCGFYVRHSGWLEVSLVFISHKALDKNTMFDETCSRSH